MIVWSLAIGLLFLLAAAFYVPRARHPDAKPLAAYLIFVTVFLTVAFVLFLLAVWGLEALDRGELLDRAVPSALIMLPILAVAFLLARRQIRRPPWQPPRI